MTVKTALSRDNPRVGTMRPNDLLFTAGIGALVDLPHLSVVVRGLDYWDHRNSDVQLLSEPRLLQRIRQVLGPQVRELRPAPLRESPRGEDAASRHVGVPVAPFPRWMRCTHPQCRLLAGLRAEGDHPFELYNPSVTRPDRARFIHADCHGAKSRAKAPSAIPARFVFVCEAGHLDDFPYSDYTHDGGACPRGVEERLSMQDPGSSLGSAVTLRCACGAVRNMQDALRHHRMPERGFLPPCRGRHPHLGIYEDRCEAPVRAMVLGASNQWFGLVESALSIPEGRSELQRLVDRHWSRLRPATSRDFLAGVLSGQDLAELAREHDVNDIWEVVRRRRGEESAPVLAEPIPLLAQEYAVLCDPTQARVDPNFTAIPVDPPQRWRHLLARVVRLERLRETRALIGFTRVEAPEWAETDAAHRAPISRGAPEWVPAAETHGEGLFLALDGNVVRAWEEAAARGPRLEALRQAYTQWRTNRALQTGTDERWVGDRYLMLHTLSHLLIREIALECGYSAASIKERLYADGDGDQAGILLYTAASDSEGTLGGLVRLGEPGELGRIIDQALEAGRRCSSDPLCAEHLPTQGRDSLHGAACHACLFASETTCENGNRFLDRALVVDLGDGADLSLEAALRRIGG